MKSFKSILALVAMLMLLGSTAMAAVVAVKADGSGVGGYTTIEAAVTASVAGDTIEIQDSAVYDIKSVLILTDRNLKGAAGFLPTIKATGVTAGVDAVGYLLVMENTAIENLKLVGKYGTGAWPADWQMGAFVHGAFDIKNCWFIDFQANALSFVALDGKLLTGTMSGCYTVNCASQPLYFEDRTPEGGTRPTSANVGAMLFDHNTLLARGWIFALAANFPSNGGTITVKNSIMGAFYKENPWGFANGKAFSLTNPYCTEWFRDSSNNPVAGAHTSNDFIHSYNAYIGVWMFKWNWQDIDYNSMMYQGDIGATELGTTNQQVMDVGFVDPLNYDLSLKPSSKLIGRGEGGSTMGAYQSPTPPVPQFIVKQDGTGNFTTIEAAMAAATYGDLIEIGDSGIYDVTADIHLLGMSLRGAEGVRPTIKHTAGGDPGRCIYELQSGSLENLTIVGHPTTQQMGLAGGGRLSIKNCRFENFTQDSCAIIGAQANTPLTGEISSCYFYNCGPNTIAFAGWGTVTAADAGLFTIDHCTFLNTAGPFAYIENGYPSSGGMVTVKNSIMTAYTGGAFVAAKPFGAEVLAKVRFKHSYNLYNVLDATGFGFVIDPAGTELSNVDPKFTNIATGDLTVKATAPASPAIFKGEGGSTIGVFQAMPPNAAKSWTVFE